jgi:sugar lactone lactonase YvrE
VQITRIEEGGGTSRAVLTGGAVSFESSDLLSVGGDSGKRLLRIRAANNSREGILNNARLVIASLLHTTLIDVKLQTTVSTFAGSGTAGNANGYGTTATFNAPQGLEGGQGPNRNTLFVADSTNHLVRAIQLDGTVSTLAGSAGVSGPTDGVGSAARFNQPADVATDRNGNVFVADYGNNRIRRITPLGEVTTIAGTGATGSNDGTANLATFRGPTGIAVESQGNRIYVCDADNHLVRMISWSGGPRDQASSYTVSTVAGQALTSGLADGPGGNARFSLPAQLTLTDETPGIETLYVADAGNQAIRRIATPFTSAVVSTIAGGNGSGTQDGIGAVARFQTPRGIDAVEISSGRFVFLISENHQLRLLTMTPGGEPTQKGSYQVMTFAGSSATGNANGNGNAARFNTPSGVFAVPGSGINLYLADYNNNLVRKVVINSSALMQSGGPLSAVSEPVRLLNWDAEIPTQGAFAKWLTPIPASETMSAELQFYIPQGISGFSFTAYLETDTNLINLPAVGASYLMTLAGDGRVGSANGNGNIAQFNQPYGLVAVPANLRGSWHGLGLPNVRAFVVDGSNHRIRYVTEEGVVGTLAGSSAGFTDGSGTSAQFNGPRVAALHPDGSLFVSDLFNRRIRRIAPDGSVTTIAGTGTAGSADGPGSTATVNSVEGMVIDSGGTIFITDAGSHSVRRIDYVSGDPSQASAYRLTTVAGGTSGSLDGTGSAARFNVPAGIATDGTGRLYVADVMNHTVRVLTRTTNPNAMAVTTLAGSAGLSGTADGTGSAARFNTPTGITADSARNLYVVDFGSHRARRISPQGQVVTLLGSSAGFSDGASGTLNGPRHIALETTGTLLISDLNNHSLRALHRVISEGQPPLP